MNVIGVIPARLSASRFPRKPLAEILGIPMIGHCYLRSRMCPDLSETYVATCDREIVDYVETLGGKAIMTATTHERATDRTAEAMLSIEKETGKPVDIVVMIQGDEPLVTPSMISLSINALLSADDAGVACLMGRIKDTENFNDRNEIKVVVDRSDYALYFSREPIPSTYRGPVNELMLKQVCIISYRRDYLLRFQDLEPTALEIAESIDLNRCLEHGDRVKMALTMDSNVSVDNSEDLAEAEKAMQSDPLVERYLDLARGKRG